MGKKDFVLLKISDVLILFTFFSSRRALRSRIAEMVIPIGHTILLPSDWSIAQKDRRFVYIQDNDFFCHRYNPPFPPAPIIQRGEGGLK